MEVRAQVGRFGEKDLIVASRDGQPRDRKSRVERLDRFEAVAHFDDKEAVCGEVVRRLFKNALDDVHSVRTRGERECGFPAVLRGQRRKATEVSLSLVNVIALTYGI